MSTLKMSAITRSFPRGYASLSARPRHLLSIADLTPSEFARLVQNSAAHKTSFKSDTQSEAVRTALRNQTVAMTFSKLSTRTRVSTEAAVAALGGHPMFLGKGDIQLGVNETLRDTSQVISSMVSGIVARVGPHSDVEGLAEYSSVPVINALSDRYHPLQIVADYLTINEAFGKGGSHLGAEGLKIAWVGDANNVLFDFAIAAAKSGVHLAVATPEGYAIPSEMKAVIKDASNSASNAGQLSETAVPEEAVKGADIIVTDTWISMGQEEEKVKRLKAFDRYQITEQLGKRGGAKDGWRFMHCLPRHPEEVSDEVFYGPRSLVFQEAENRLWAAIAVLEAFLVNKGRIE